MILKKSTDRRHVERRLLPRRKTDQTIPPVRVYCCPESLDIIEHHLGNGLTVIKGYLQRRLREKDPQDKLLLGGALKETDRINRVVLALHRCPIAELSCPYSKQTGWKRSVLSWISSLLS